MICWHICDLNWIESAYVSGVVSFLIRFCILLGNTRERGNGKLLLYVQIFGQLRQVMGVINGQCFSQVGDYRLLARLSPFPRSFSCRICIRWLFTSTMLKHKHSGKETGAVSLCLFLSLYCWVWVNTPTLWLGNQNVLIMYLPLFCAFGADFE